MSNVVDEETDSSRIRISDPGSPLTNLSIVRTRMDSLQQFLSQSVNSNTLISKTEMDMVSSEISSAIHQIIINGAALLSSAAPVPQPSEPQTLETTAMQICDESDFEVVELDAVELLAEHIHFCEICGKGFKRDANLRMHMRAHGNEYKTPEALAKPERPGNESEKKRRFSCPFEGCNRNKKHQKFRSLKSVTCVKNHFKRSHCPKTYQCERCKKKCFSVESDLKSHYKHCGGGGSQGGGESKWRCSCGTTFSRKDKLFGHVALFEGHMPMIVEKMKDDHTREKDDNCLDLDDGDFQLLLDDFGSIENFCLQDVLNSPLENQSSNFNGEFL